MQCAHRGVSYALAWQRVMNPESARASLGEVVARFERRTGVTAARQPDGLPQGALEWSESGHYLLQGANETVHVLVWARGLTVYQATVFGPAGAAPLTEGMPSLFVAGIRSLP